MLGSIIEQLTLTDLTILAALIAYAVKEALDHLGMTRSSKILRRENEDLIRRNSELELTVTRLDGEATAQRQATQILDEKVRDLEKRDQRAVLSALELHERHAQERHVVSTELLRELVSEVKSFREAA